MITIDSEAKKNSKIPLNIEYFTARYKTNNGYFTFPSPSLELIERNLFYILSESEERKLEQRYHYRPSYLSFSEYGTIVLDKLLMFINGIFVAEDFNTETIMVPKLSTIINVLQDKYSDIDKEKSKLISVNW